MSARFTQRNKMKKHKKREPVYTAATADKHVLYEMSVQNAEADMEFIQKTFQSKRGRKPRSLREDFCGTAKLCATWAANSEEATAVGIDLDESTLTWGRTHNLGAIGSAASRVELLNKNVLDPIVQKSDVAVAFNFSYCIFKERETLLNYFKQVREGLSDDGAFLLDIHGGTECHESLEEVKDFEGYEYVWDQEPYDAIQGTAKRFIHFRFPDGTEMSRAFEYDWRLWSLPELRDLMLEAGFTSAQCYWEGDDGDGEGNGIFTETNEAENEISWIAYLVGWV